MRAGWQCQHQVASSPQQPDPFSIDSNLEMGRWPMSGINHIDPYNTSRRLRDLAFLRYKSCTEMCAFGPTRRLGCLHHPFILRMHEHRRQCERNED